MSEQQRSTFEQPNPQASAEKPKQISAEKSDSVPAEKVKAASAGKPKRASGEKAKPASAEKPKQQASAPARPQPQSPAPGQPRHYKPREVRRQQRKRRKRITITILVILGIALAGVGLYIGYLNGLMGIKDEQLLSSLKESGSDEPFYILLLGVDKGEERIETDGEDDSNYRSDTIMLARIDPHEVKATIVSIHRDLLVTLENGEPGKINSAYSLGGPSGMVRAVGSLAGVDINHYAEIDFDSFMRVVDALGGVEVTLPVAVHDPDYTELDLEAGTHVLNGHDALMLCRARHAYDAYGDGDLYRAANQRMVIASIVRKILSSNPHTIVAAITTIAESLTTDLSVNDVLTLAAQMRDFDTETDLYTGMTPSEPEVIDGIYYEILNQDAWRTIMSRVDAGQPPYASETSDETLGIAGSTHALPEGMTPPVSSSGATSSSGTSSAGGSGTSSVTVMGAATGDANYLARELTSLGFDATGYEDEEYVFYDNVVIIDDPAYEEMAYNVAACLGGQFTVIYNDGSYYQPTPILVRVAS